MKNPSCLSTYALFTLLLALACGRDSTREIVSPELDLLDASSGPSASGHGNWVNPQGEYVSRSFDAREKTGGIVEGNYPPDQMSGLFFRTHESGMDCRSFLPPLVTPIEAGNLQVKP